MDELVKVTVHTTSGKQVSVELGTFGIVQIQVATSGKFLDISSISDDGQKQTTSFPLDKVDFLTNIWLPKEDII